MVLWYTCVIAAIVGIFWPSATSALTVGPYSGQVVDSQTGQPIQGASVLIYWEKSSRTPLGGISGLAKARIVYTDHEGKYHVGTTSISVGLIGSLGETHIIIYEPGYQAYMERIDHLFNKSAHTHTTTNQVTKLDRIPPNFDHRGHHARIERALWGLREHSFYPEEGMTWHKLLEMNSKAVPEKTEFLRRVEWEERRGIMGKRR